MTTEKGIYYPTDYSDVADIPADMKEMAESIDNALTSLDGEIEGTKEEQQTQNTQINNNKTDIETIKTEQTEQNTDIQANTDNITALLEKIDYIEGLIPTDTATGENITITDSARYPFKEFNVGGNTKQATAILPDEYQQVDYIESSGTQYIDTGVSSNATMLVDLVASITKSDSQQGIFGASGSVPTNSQLRLYTGQNGDVNKLQFNYGGLKVIDYTTNISGLDTTTKTRYTFGNGKIALNGTDYTTYSTQTFDYAQNCIVFGSKSVNGTADFLATMKLYSLKITDNDIEIRNFIPCIRKSDNVIGLYDTVNNVFYTNAGTGTFTYGSAVTLPNPDFPIEVENVSGEVEVKVETPNIFNPSTAKVRTISNYNTDSWRDVTNNTSVTIDENNVLHGTASSYIVIAFPFKFEEGKTIYNKNSSGITGRTFMIYKGYQVLSAQGAALSYTPNSTFEGYLGIGINSGLNVEGKQLMFSYDNNATFVPHEEQTATLHLPEGMEMCKIGDVQDSFVEQAGKWYKNKVISRLKLRSSGSWTFNESNHTFSLSWDLNNVTNVYCNYYKWNTSASVNFSIYVHRYGVRITDDRFDNLADFKAFLLNNEVYIYYNLREAVRTLEEITDITLISDLNNLKDLYSYKGTTYISSTNEPSPVFEVVYRKSLG